MLEEPPGGFRPAPVWWSDLTHHVEETFPEEACGLFTGSADLFAPDVRVVPLANVAVGDRRRAFVIDPSAHLAALRRADAEGRSCLAYFHSHPEGSLELSPADLHAWQVSWGGAGQTLVVVNTRAGRAFRARVHYLHLPAPLRSLG